MSSPQTKRSGTDDEPAETASKDWRGFAIHVRQKKVALGVCLISSSLKSFDEKGVTIGFAKWQSFQKDQVERPNNREFLRRMLKKYFGRDLELTCVTETEAEDANGVEGGPGHESASPRPFESEPRIKKILADFDGEIIRYNPH